MSSSTISSRPLASDLRAVRADDEVALGDRLAPETIAAHDRGDRTRRAAPSSAPAICKGSSHSCCRPFVDAPNHHGDPRASDIERYANELEAEQRTPRNAAQAVVRAAQLSKGEIAGLVFERLEQRHSLAEIVIALRVPPEDVRDLYHTWLVGLWAGELQHPEPALPARLSDHDATRRVSLEQLLDLLAALPDKQPTRISVARMVGERIYDPRGDAATFTEYRNLTELGGFVVSGPTSISEITNRFGAGEYRVAAYGLEIRGLRWEVFSTLVDAGSVANHVDRARAVGKPAS